jgi:hypothetical protein
MSDTHATTGDARPGQEHPAYWRRYAACPVPVCRAASGAPCVARTVAHLGRPLLSANAGPTVEGALAAVRGVVGWYEEMTTDDATDTISRQWVLEQVIDKLRAITGDTPEADDDW